MENINSGRKWGNIALVISFFGILFGVISLFGGIPVYNSIGLVLVGFAGLFGSIVLREESTERYMPIPRFASGVCIAAAFLQAVSVKNQYFAVAMYFIAAVFLILLAVNIYKNSKDVR